jgi:hypothetical protein
MRYQILIYNNDAADAAINGELEPEFRAAHDGVLDELRASGELVDSNVLDIDPAEAKIVRISPEGRTLVSDGPYAESKEWVGGYYLVDVTDLDRAIEIAGRFVEGRFSPIEVRRQVY